MRTVSEDLVELGLEKLDALLERRDNILASAVTGSRNGGNQEGSKSQKLEHPFREVGSGK